MGSKYFYNEEEIIDGESTAKSLLTQIATKRQVDLSVVGFHGRKGPKADPTIMGSAVQFMSINTTQPIMILKRPRRRNQKPNNAYNHALCCDGSKESLKALEMICRIRMPQDSIIVIVCEQANIDVEKVRERVSKKLEQEECLGVSKIEILKS